MCDTAELGRDNKKATDEGWAFLLKPLTLMGTTIVCRALAAGIASSTADRR
jgi:hypothetical protein